MTHNPHEPYNSPDVAALYDSLNAWAHSDEFYLSLVMQAPTVLDVGCGTGMLLRTARDRGHTGHLVGLDPAQAMLQVAHQRTNVDWVQGDLSTHSWQDEFALVTMTGHAFQELRTDTDISQALQRMRQALTPNGLVAFETRNPAVRAWQRWTPQYPLHARTLEGVQLHDVNDAEPITPQGLVSFTSTTTSPEWTEPLITHSTLRFIDADHLDDLLAGAGLEVVDRFGDWDRSPFLTESSPEIITVAHPATAPQKPST